MGQRGCENAYFLFLTHTKQLLLVTFCDTIAVIGDFFLDKRTETETGKQGRTDRKCLYCMRLQ